MIEMQSVLNKLGIAQNNFGVSTGTVTWAGSGELIKSFSPVDGKEIAEVTSSSHADYNKVIETAQQAFKEWRLVPAPKRGEIVRQIGEQLRLKKEALGTLVSYEMGKSLQ